MGATKYVIEGPDIGLYEYIKKIINFFVNIYLRFLRKEVKLETLEPHEKYPEILEWDEGDYFFKKEPPPSTRSRSRIKSFYEFVGEHTKELDRYGDYEYEKGYYLENITHFGTVFLKHKGEIKEYKLEDVINGFKNKSATKRIQEKEDAEELREKELKEEAERVRYEALKENDIYFETIKTYHKLKEGN